VTEEALALRYRPKSFPEMVGNRMHAIVLANMVAEDKVPPVLIFSGPSGVGKTTAARILASELKATDVIEVDAASTGGVNEIRSILDVTRYSTGGGYRLIILDEAHSITRQGSEALLKTLEEPPEKTIFVLATTDPGKIDRTVKSRAMEFPRHGRPRRDADLARVPGSGWRA
jgi:DNA polymerase-3 subunit gamma/tau